MKPSKIALLLVAGSFAAVLRAAVVFAPLFTDHAVLQRGKPAPVWGSADPGERITVTFQEQTLRTTADSNGRWSVTLVPMPATGTGSDLVAAGKSTAVAHDIVVGEVWIASGQSNMEFTVSDPQKWQFVLKDAASEVAAANFPLIRQFKVASEVAEAPSKEANGAWQPCAPKTVGTYTAVGYFFARNLFQRLGVPVGIINTSWGGSPIESWMSAPALASDPAFAVVRERWNKIVADYPDAKANYDADLAKWTAGADAAKAKGGEAYVDYVKTHPNLPFPRFRVPGGPGTPSGLYNGMVRPLAPFAIRGTIWYQGEANGERATEYHRLFAAMIGDWRRTFGQGDFPFLWVQLANFRGPRDLTHMTWAFLREAQTQTLSIPHTGQALTIDIGDPDNIHPGNKQEVGRRLALIAFDQVYGIPGDYSGPLFAGAAREGRSMRVRFKFVDAGLKSGNGVLHSFELAGTDRDFKPADASIEGNTVVVTSPEVSEPVAVRYAWRNSPEANLYGGSGLPAVPFRSDSW